MKQSRPTPTASTAAPAARERAASPDFRTSLFKSDVRKSGEAALSLAAGAAVLAVGVGLLCFMLVYLLHWAVPALPLWACYGLVGAVLLGLGAARTWYGRR